MSEWQIRSTISQTYINEIATNGNEWQRMSEADRETTTTEEKKNTSQRDSLMFCRTDWDQSNISQLIFTTGISARTLHWPRLYKTKMKEERMETVVDIIAPSRAFLLCRTNCFSLLLCPYLVCVCDFGEKSIVQLAHVDAIVHKVHGIDANSRTAHPHGKCFAHASIATAILHTPYH